MRCKSKRNMHFSLMQKLRATFQIGIKGDPITFYDLVFNQVIIIAILYCATISVSERQIKRMLSLFTDGGSRSSLRSLHTCIEVKVKNQYHLQWCNICTLIIFYGRSVLGYWILSTVFLSLPPPRLFTDGGNRGLKRRG